MERGGASVERAGARAESLLLLTRRGVSGRRQEDHRRFRVKRVDIFLEMYSRV